MMYYKAKTINQNRIVSGVPDKWLVDIACRRRKGTLLRDWIIADSDQKR